MSLPLPPVQAANKYITTDANGQPVATYDVDLAITDVTVVANQAARLALSAQKGDVAIQTDTGKTYILATNSPTTNGDWKEILAFGAQTATNVAFTPTGTIAASTVQAAIAEVATDAAVATSLTSGTIPDARFPATLPAASGVNLTALNATNLGSGTVPDARFPATLPAASGVNLTALNATNLASGTVPDARMPATLTPLLTLGSALQQIRVNAGGTALEFFTP